MNERIRELAEQAGYKPLSPPTFADELNEIFMQKFAELIVKECLGICKEKEQANLYGVREVENTIKEHFGVE